MLVLPSEIKNDIRENAERFFIGDRTVYRRLGLPHKRGFIFIGEPGDGKTLTGKIIANTYKVTFIYVTSLQSPHQTPSQCLRDIYDRAQEQAPCVVLIEDLDSQIDRSSRTVFLNILDGFDHNDGILTIATTNNPEDIDRALLDRPSRFDKKWVFPHPDAFYRAAYLTRRLCDVLALPELSAELHQAIQELAEKTNRYSYAMLQELVVSAGFVYFANGQSGDFAQILRDAYLKTKEQIKFADPEKISDIAKGRNNMSLRGNRISDYRRE
jgi:ATP-dependent 26S proteasome regulatory subunit